jgi:NAD(P)H-dependent FMN reductase
MAAKKIALIVTSTRPNRVGLQVGETISKILAPEVEKSGNSLEIVDVADFNLPIFNETTLPAMVPEKGQFQHEHSKKWSAKIASYDAYILTSAEYNFGPPASAKNAIDYLYNDWIGKPIAVITYGIHGGKSSNDALRATVKGMKLRLTESAVALGFEGGAGPALYSAVGGVLDEPTKEKWVGEKEELFKAYSELIALLEAAPPTPALV